MKTTRFATIDPQLFTDEALQPFARMLAAGKTVAFPTETVYGLGADATNPRALAAIFEAKGRPSDNPLIVHVAAPEDIEPLVKTVTPLARKLMAHFWPGPLTIILEKSPAVPDMVTAGLDTVALRMPAHPLARRLIALAGVPVAAPSANQSGRPSPTRGSHVVKDLEGRVDAIIDGGPCEVGLESTVVDATGSFPVILRPGGVTREMLLMVVDHVAVDAALVKKDFGGGESVTAPRSPGMKYTHYAPKAPLILARSSRPAETTTEAAHVLITLALRHQKAEAVMGILCTDETAAILAEMPETAKLPLVVKSLGSVHHPEEMAANLFLRLREFDETPASLIITEALSDNALGFALMNRLVKAAGNQWEEA
ncbi:L-threonylcarbamoyladenylate synthase [Anoxynatronum sibiricum]|uniref:Threonylcarbamoyl-AMP synthase n=1 Tax=Anoxynatronum sibiricum TaxID=210623 RepID=A0ABU9VU17_9CLOT